MDAFTPAFVAERFQLGRPKGPLEFVARGQNNPLGVCRLRTDDGCYAVKRFEAPPRNSALIIETTAFEAGIAMPRPIRTCNEQLYETCQVNDRTIWVRVYRWVPGQPQKWGYVDPDTSNKVGGLLASIHGLSVSPEALLEDDTQEWSALTATGWRELADCATQRQLAWASELRRKIPILVSQEDHIAQNSRKDESIVAGQRDMHPPNVVKTATSDLVVVDWDAAGPVVARDEVAKYALIWATPENGRPQEAAVHALIDGYHDGGGTFDTQGWADLTYQLKTLLWWLAFNIRRDLSDRPGPDPDLTPALLSRIGPFDIADFEYKAALLDH